METISGNIFNYRTGEFIKGTIVFNETIVAINEDNSVEENTFIIPGLVDSHMHIESSMLTPLEYSKVALRHGVVGAVTDPHEIANVCGINGVEFMLDNSQLSPMKIYTGAPSCVPATEHETSGAVITSEDIEELFKKNKCSHLSEMMNFPGVIYKEAEVLKKLGIAKKFNKKIDGHAPLLTGDKLRRYISEGISTEHESTSINEALEKIEEGLKIFIRESTASHGFELMHELISTHTDSIMLCTDDCHPADLENNYIDQLFRRAIKKGHSIENIIKVASINAINHYGLNIGLLRINDPADFIIIDNFTDFNIMKVVIDGKEIFDGKVLKFTNNSSTLINKFVVNNVSEEDIKVEKTGSFLNVIKAIDDSLITHKLKYRINVGKSCVETDVNDDILKIVVVNRYKKVKPSVGFINGFKLNRGAIGSTIAHDSHNIIVIGTSDDYIIKAINLLQESKGGLVIANKNIEHLLKLPVAGLMSNQPIETVAAEYEVLSKEVKEMGCQLKNPFITLSFMALLVIPELKIGDKGLFDVDRFEIAELQM